MSAGSIPLGSKTCPEGLEVTVNVQAALPHHGSASTRPRSVPLTGPVMLPNQLGEALRVCAASLLLMGYGTFANEFSMTVTWRAFAATSGLPATWILTPAPGQGAEPVRVILFTVVIVLS